MKMNITIDGVEGTVDLHLTRELTREEATELCEAVCRDFADNAHPIFLNRFGEDIGEINTEECVHME